MLALLFPVLFNSLTEERKPSKWEENKMFITEKECSVDCSGVARVIDKNAPLWQEMEKVACELEAQAVAAKSNEVARQARAMRKQAQDALAAQKLPYVVCREMPLAYIRFLEAAR